VPVPAALPESSTPSEEEIGGRIQEQGPGVVPEPHTEEAMPVPQQAPTRTPSGSTTISRDRWLDIIKWAHHSESLKEEDRKALISDLMRLSKLVQKGRHLTNRQDQDIRALVARVQSLGYRFV
jgi:hypothetical protein